jgi:ribonuclease P/MRP protein subunit RPP1
MYFDLNVLVPPLSRTTGPTHAQSNKGKGKQVQPALYSQAQIDAIEARIDFLVHCAHSLVVTVGNVLIGRPVGYSVFAFNQCIETKIEPKTFVNVLDPLLHLVKKRPGIIYLKRLTIVLDGDSEKGFGLVRFLFPSYDHALPLTDHFADKRTFKSLQCLRYHRTCAND